MSIATEMFLAVKGEIVLLQRITFSQWPKFLKKIVFFFATGMSLAIERGIVYYKEYTTNKLIFICNRIISHAITVLLPSSSKMTFCHVKR